MKVNARSEVSARPLRFMDTKASVLLDLVRGLSALAVLCEHWRMLLFVSYPKIPSHRWLFALPYTLFSAGHQAVVIFFVLSGYLVSGSVFRMLKQGRWSWRTYGLHRLVRLWIVLIPGLALTSLWDQIGMHLHSASAVALYSGQSGDWIVRNVHAASGVGAFFGNLFFLQNIRVLTFGSDQALWSLSNEFWYYVLFPLGLISLRSGSRLFIRVSSGVVFLCVALFIGRNILSMFPIWLFGTALALCPAPKLGWKARWMAAAIYIPIFFGIGRLEFIPLLYRDYILGAGTFVLLWTFLSARSAVVDSELGVRFARTLARFSYTLYVAHMPLLVLFAALLVGPDRWMPTAAHLAIGLGLLITVVCFSFFLAKGTEFNTDKVRSGVERLLEN
jgi:peptidoglycan/LPS O-acetylase OafA/YrhL